MMMKKIIAVLLLTALAAMVFAGCAAQNTGIARAGVGFVCALSHEDDQYAGIVKGIESLMLDKTAACTIIDCAGDEALYEHNMEYAAEYFRAVIYTDEALFALADEYAAKSEECEFIRVGGEAEAAVENITVLAEAGADGAALAELVRSKLVK